MTEMMSQKLTNPPPEAVVDPSELATRFQGGDEGAFDQVVRLYAADIRTLAHRLTGWDGPAEDITQDVFVAALASRKKFRAQSSLKTWLFQITLNKCRKWKYRRRLFFNFMKHQKNTIPQEADQDRHFDQFDHVRKTVAALPHTYRQVLVLKYLQELSTAEVLDILNITESTLNTRLSRARQMLREKLINENDEP